MSNHSRNPKGFEVHNRALGWKVALTPRRRPRGSGSAPAGWNVCLLDGATLAMMIGVDRDDALLRVFAASGFCSFVAAVLS